MFERIIFLFILIESKEFDPLIIHIREELHSNILLIPSISNNSNLIWLPSSTFYRHYFLLKENQSLFTSDQPIDREQLCQVNRCNCSMCWIHLNFLDSSTNQQTIQLQTVSILVEDINDHSPEFEQSSIYLSIGENAPIGYEIALRLAIDLDRDQFSIQTYRLFPMLNNPFSVILNNSTLKLRLVEPLNREIRSSYPLKLIAYDGGDPVLFGEQLIFIQVTDVNDNAPLWNQTTYQIKIPEDQEVSTRIFQVFAEDFDEGENGRIDYSIEDLSETFTIDQRTGEIKLNRSIDYELISQFSFSLKAEDNGQPRLKSYATLNIEVTDVNDCAPLIILTKLNHTSVNETSFHLSECFISEANSIDFFVNDHDQGQNGCFQCQLNDTRFILVELSRNFYSCQTSNSSSFNAELESTIYIEILCSDFGQPSLSTSKIITVHIDVCPRFDVHLSSALPMNSSISILYENIKLPLLITRIIIKPTINFNYSLNFTVDPWINLTLAQNGSLILESIPKDIGSFNINVTVLTRKTSLDSILIPLEIYTINRNVNWIQIWFQSNTSLIVVVGVLFFIFLLSISVGLNSLIIFLSQHSKSISFNRNSSSLDHIVNSA